jgi:hypothetical protein
MWLFYAVWIRHCVSSGGGLLLQRKFWWCSWLVKVEVVVLSMFIAHYIFSGDGCQISVMEVFVALATVLVAAHCFAVLVVVVSSHGCFAGCYVWLVL